MDKRGVMVVRVLQALTVVVWGYFMLMAVFDPALFARLTAKDGPNWAGGAAEHLPVVVLAIGVGCAVWALVKYRRRMPAPLAWPWLAGWTAACVYFAGEECSWGQWYLGFETPEMLKKWNDQGEANLHNIGHGWLDQKPRALVEVCIVMGGLVLPLGLRAFAAGRRLLRWWLVSWTLAPAVCWPAAGVFIILRASSRIPGEVARRWGESEFMEFGIAWYLSVYLVSFLIRLKWGGVERGTWEEVRGGGEKTRT